MKKLLVCLTLVAVATLTAVQAGEPSKDKATCSAQTTSCCPASKTASTGKCSEAAKRVVNKNADVKGATLLVRR